MHELLRIDHLTAGYGGNAVIHDICLALQPGEVLGIVGAAESRPSSRRLHRFAVSPQRFTQAQ